MPKPTVTIVRIDRYPGPDFDLEATANVAGHQMCRRGSREDMVSFVGLITRSAYAYGLTVKVVDRSGR